jgi:glycerol-3-phosphate acyltransferase PlsY
MLESIAVLAAAYAIGSIPIAWLAGRAAKGVDIRNVGSGNTGASNVFQSVSRSLVVPVGVAQIAQGTAAVLLARAFGQSDAVQASAGVAAVAANDWNPWLGFTGGRGVGQAIGVMLVLSPVALASFILVALIGVAIKTIPQFVALALVLAPLAAVIAGDSAAATSGCAALAVLILLKRLLANAAPAASAPRPHVWIYRLLYDRDIRDRGAWVRRHLDGVTPAE